MWIMLTCKIPVEVSPPVGSIHWSGASAADLNTVHRQSMRSKDFVKYKIRFDELIGPLDDLGDVYFDGRGYEPKEELSRWIIYDSEPVKVWAHEFTQVSDENLALYLQGTAQEYIDASHVPMYSREALFAHPVKLKIVENFALYPEFDKDVYEAALVDGADQLTAFYTSLGRFPRNLWYAMVKPYGDMFGYKTKELYPIFRKKDEVYEQIKQGWKEKL